MSRFDKIEELIDRVPESSVFVTVDELYARAAQVAAKAPELAELRVVGKSTKGSDIPMLTVGRGPVSILVFACPHPNEPIGAMMMYFLMEELIENPLLREGRAWHILPCVDPDGTRLNEGWFKGPFTIRNYAKGFYRPKPQDQVEWTFPITYKTLSWTTPKPETQALMEAILMAKPDVMYSLHNAGFGGAYYYVSHELPAECYEELRRIPVARGIELSLGEPEMPWVEELSPAVYKTTSTVDSYEYFAKFAPGDPAEFVVAGAGSTEWAQSQRDLFSLVTEVPYFTSPKTSDQNPVARARRDVLLEGLERSREIYGLVNAMLERTKGKLDAGDAPLLWEAVATFVDSGLKSLPSQERWARETPGMEAPATVAQEADSLYIRVFYQMLIASMLSRAIKMQLSAEGAGGDAESGENAGDAAGEGAASELAAVGRELDAAIDGWASDIERNLSYEVVPIRNLVQVQYGALLAVLECRGM